MTVVIASRNRADELRRTVRHLLALPERPAVVVVDNASQDGTSAAVRRDFPEVTVVSLSRNTGAVGRNIGAAQARTRYVAFSDDDSWWEPGSLRRAAAVLDDNPRVGLIAARTLVGEAREPDPVNTAMRESPLPSDGLPGPRVLGFLGCAAVVRRTAFLAVGGYSELLFIGGEEPLLAMDLAAAGWGTAYIDEVVACHYPSQIRDHGERHRLEARNRVIVAWLRRPAGVAVLGTADLLRRAAARDPAASWALASLLRRMPRVLLQRRVLPAEIEEQVRLLSK